MLPCHFLALHCSHIMQMREGGRGSWNSNDEEESSELEDAAKSEGEIKQMLWLQHKALLQSMGASGSLRLCLGIQP